MKYYIQQRVFTLTDKFSIYDSEGNECFYVQGDFTFFGKRLHLYSMEGKELAFIERELFSFLPRYSVYINGGKMAEVVKEFTFFRNIYSIIGLGWTVDGNFLDHDYTISSEGREIAAVCKQWLSWGDAYEIYVSDEIDPTLAISVTLIIDACLDAEKD